MSMEFFRKREFIVFLILVAVFLFLRLPAVNSPYHQDEYKWPIIVNPALTEPGGIPHPPVGEFVYKKAGQIIGYDNFRFVPLVFSFVNLFLLFYLVKNIADKKSAFISISLFCFSFYSALASLMVDTDGAIMPFFFLLSAIAYYKLKTSNFKIDKSKLKWLLLFAISIVLGFLVKVSFLIGVMALVLDFAIEKGVFLEKKRILKYVSMGVLGLIGLVALLFLAKLVFPSFNLQSSLKYWKHFANSSSFIDRGWMQTFIQFVKAILYTSPLLISPLFFIDKEIWQKTRPFFFFIFIGLFFYLFAFDFSIGALDRYLQFLIIPLCIIVGAIFANNFSNNEENISIKEIIFVSIISFFIFSIQFIDHYVPPLYPKTEWISRILSFKWNFLYPFSGGSGPIPFYIAFDFMALILVYALALVVPAFLKNNFKKSALVGVLILGLMYNGVFFEEYLFGKINGSAKTLVNDSVSFISDNEKIKKVVVYNDNGGFNVSQTGKYERRLYAVPQFESGYKDFFGSYDGHVLYIDIPRIGEGFYSDYFNSCMNIYEEKDKYITAKILDCKK